MNKIYNQIINLLKKCESKDSFMPPTILFNEGWMLRLILDRFASISTVNNSHPLNIPSGCKWHSEALLPSAFLADSQSDKLAESWTHADGVIGNFNIGESAKGDLTLESNATHFVVLEAKMFSKLSGGVRHAPSFNQAARNVSCIAEVLCRAKRKPDELRTLGFYVVAPSSQIEQGIFNKFLNKGSIKELVNLRVSKYTGDRRNKLNQWFSDWFLPTLNKIDIQEVSWGSLIDFLTQNAQDAEGLRKFYNLCLKFNQPNREDRTITFSRVSDRSG